MINRKSRRLLVFALLASICSSSACGKDQPTAAEKSAAEQGPAKASPAKPAASAAESKPAAAGPKAPPRAPTEPAAEPAASALADGQVAQPAPSATAAAQVALADGQVAPPPPLLSEAAARLLLDGWLQARNGRRFEAYAELYAEKMAGVVYKGPQVRVSDRESWLKERRRAFRRRVRLSTENEVIRIAGGAVVIWFDQSTSSRSRELSGPRRLLAVPEGGTLRIVNESVLPAKDPPAEEHAIAPARFMFAIQLDRTYLVLSPHQGERDVSGDPRLLGRGELFAAAKPVENSSLSGPLRALPGKQVQLYTDGGVACSGKLGEPMLVRRIVPHSRMRAFWEGKADGSQGERPSDDAVARDVWELGREKTLLVAPVSRGLQSCERAVWGRVVAEQRSPEIFLGTVADWKVMKKVADRVRPVSAYRSLSANLKEADRGKRLVGVRSAGDSGPDIRVWSSNDIRLHSISAAVGGDCGGSTSAPWVLYQVMGKTWLMLTEGRRQVDVRPVAVADVDSDKRIEVLAAPRLYHTGEAANLWRQTAELVFEPVCNIEAVYLDDGC